MAWSSIVSFLRGIRWNYDPSFSFLGGNSRNGTLQLFVVDVFDGAHTFYERALVGSRVEFSLASGVQAPRYPRRSKGLC